MIYRQTYNVRRSLTDSKIVEYSDEFWAPPVGAAQTISSFSILGCYELSIFTETDLFNV